MQSGDIRRRRQLEIRPIRAVLPACDARLLYHGEYRPRCINVRHADGHSPDAITPTEIVYCSYIQIIKKHDSLRHVQHQKWLVYRKRAHRRNAYTRAANACHFIIQPLAGATIGRDVMNTHARTHTNATNNTSSFFLFTAATQSNTRQSFAIKSVVNKRVNAFIEASRQRNIRNAVLSANGRQRALQRTLVSRPRGAMFGHDKVDESDVLRLQSVRIEVVAAPLGVHVHGDPVFSRSIGVVGVAHDRGRVA